MNRHCRYLKMGHAVRMQEHDVFQDCAALNGDIVEPRTVIVVQIANLSMVIATALKIRHRQLQSLPFLRLHLLHLDSV